MGVPMASICEGTHRSTIDRPSTGACLKVEVDLDFWARLANDDISTCTWPMIANEDALDIYLTSLTSSRPRLWRKRYSSPRNLMVNTPHFPSLLRRRQIMRRKPFRRRQWAERVEEGPEACI